MDEQTRALLDTLHRGGAYAFWWTAEGKASTWWHTGKPAPLPAGRRNVYVGVHPVAAIPETNARGEHTESRAVRSQVACVSAINCLFAEYDAKDFNNDKPACRAAIAELDPPPSAIVDSGGGYHCYWLLEKPFPLATPDARARAVKIQAAWVRLMGSDPASKDLARVLRVPGTKNYKYDPPRDVVLNVLNERRYRWAELAKIAEPFVESDRPAAANGTRPTDRYGAAALAGEITNVVTALDGQKHKELFKSAARIGELVSAHALDYQEARTALYAAIESRAKDKPGALKTIEDGLAKGMSNPRDIPLPKNGTHTNGTTPESAEPAAPAPLTRSGEIVQALHSLGYTFRLNVCDDTVEVNGVPLNDILAAHIRTQMRDLQIKPLAAVEDAYITDAAANAYHPIRDYLNGLVYDGGDHIAELASYIDCSDEEVHYDDGSVRSLAHVYLRRWLIGAVAKALCGAQNLLLVFAGPQGIGKSEQVRWLCKSIPAYFIEAPINVADKDSDVRLISRFIWEVSELDATTRKADVSALKAFITKQTVSVRKSYGRHDTVKPALASFFGTVNDGSGFLTDETGNRRFLIASVDAIDWSYTQIDVDQVWAEAVAAYQAGEPWRLLPCEEKRQQQTNKLHEAESVLEGWIDQYFWRTGNPDDRLTSAEIVDYLRSKDIRMHGSERAQAMEISRVLARIGITKVRTSTWRGYSGIQTKT